jgi:hypothetical protein
MGLDARAAQAGKTIGDYAIEQLFPGSGDEDLALAALETLLAAPVAEAQRGGLVGESITEVVGRASPASDPARAGVPMS